MPLNKSNAMPSSYDPTYAETSVIHYAAGYIPKALKKRHTRSKDANKKVDLMLCLDDLLDDEQNESTNWLQAINRGTLLVFNNMTFELFLTMERELHCHLSNNPEFAGNEIKMNLKQLVLYYNHLFSYKECK